jgi:hypothetical protein
MKTRRSDDCPDEKAIRSTNSLNSSQMIQRFPNPGGWQSTRAV